MALFKRLAEVIKEELFDSKTKNSAKAQPDSFEIAHRAYENTQKQKETKGVKVAKTAQTAENTPKKTAAEKRAQSHKDLSKTMRNRCARLPKKLGDALVKASESAGKGEFEETLRTYNEALTLALDEFCLMLKIDGKNMRNRQRMHLVVQNLKLSKKQSQCFAELAMAIERRGKFTALKKAELFLTIHKKMIPFVDLLIATAEKNNREYAKLPGENNAGKKTKTNTNTKSNGFGLSFKARETVIKGEPFDIDKEYPKVKSYLDDARDDYEKQKFYKALHNIRMSLEVMVKALCRKLWVPYENREALESMINKLDETGKFSAGQKKVLSDAKWFGNMGSHDNDEKEVSESDATKGFAEIKKVKAMFITFMTDEQSIRNAPVFGTNEYYSPQRKYYGRWTHCFDYASLMMIDDYVMLKEKAEKGDIQAMLDIASGFLESSICWTEESLIYLKKYRDPLYHPDPCDARYYCWILWACYTAYKDWKAGKPLPLRYLANALLEGIKFIKMHQVYKANLTSRQIVNCHDDQYAGTGKLFGLHAEYASCQDDFIKMLTAMMKEYDGKNLFAVVHKEKTIQDVEQWRVFKRR